MVNPAASRKSAPQSYTRQLAEFVANVRYDDLPQDAICAAKKCILDAIGVALLGSSTNWGREIRDFIVGVAGKPQASLIGCGDRVSCLDAAYVNGIFAKINDFDDGHRLLAMYHLGPTVVPASLAVGEWHANSGRELITAVVVGYEVGIRLGAAMDVSRKISRPNPNASCGVMAVVASVSKLLGLDVERILAAWNIAAFEMPLAMEKQNRISSLRTVITGSTARTGVLASLMGKHLSLLGSGMTFEGNDGYCKQLSGTCRPRKLVEKLGMHYHITGSYFKPYPSCRFTHPAITAVLNLLEEHRLNVREIKKVVVRIGAEGCSLNTIPLLSDAVPEHEQQTSAKFNIPYLVASTLSMGRLGIGQFEKDALADPEVKLLMGKVEVVHEPRYDAMPLRMPALVKVTTGNGREYVAQVDYPKGEPEDPLSEAEFREKFRTLASRVLPTHKVDCLEKGLDLLEGTGNIRDLLVNLTRD